MDIPTSIQSVALRVVVPVLLAGWVFLLTWYQNLLQVTFAGRIFDMPVESS